SFGGARKYARSGEKAVLLDKTKGEEHEVSASLGGLLVLGFAAPADAQLLNHKDLSLATALTIATTAMDTCKGQGYRVSVSVVGRAGEVLVQLRGDDASPHTLDFSSRKAYTARTFR